MMNRLHLGIKHRPFLKGGIILSANSFGEDIQNCRPGRHDPKKIEKRDGQFLKN